ncbi:CMP-N-acetylneuraminic acid synthetase [Parapedobacter luteus]|uniref:CMP-N-acetylneuraminic acid synthetase n=1 Tax=Parapedobacter luteus TaxID=623280 RepID=A0A1T5DFV2_9SPHI|nr:acylneuraminate cytidylyltransferase family protein [Parapedobacter luteus]SKB70507.1 CMP-N-acetylneuraminic acid synthetase [Parapedobacter luteus]
MTIAALVPMRHSSERVPGKNYRNFAGKPLFFHIVETLLAVKTISSVVVDTDSPTVMELTQKHFPSVIILERPAHLQDGSVPMNDVLLNAIDQVSADFYLQTHSTNPILSSLTIESCIKKFSEIYPMYDSLFTVTRRNVRFWDTLARPINHNQNILLRTQDLPSVFEENSCLYLFSKEILKRKHNRIGDRPFLFEIPEIEAQDIDVELNFKMAEFLYKEINGLNN